MRSLTRFTIFLTLSWALTLLYSELFTFSIVADPQLMDRTSPNLNLKSVTLGAAEFYTDIYMRWAFQMSIFPFRSDLIVFLEDQFDGGLALNDEEWQESLSCFKHIFSLIDKRTESHISIYYLSKNYNISYSGFHTQYPKVIGCYEREFGIRNYHFSAGMVEFVVVDA